MATDAVFAVGRRKEAVARVYVRPGHGKIEVNNRPLEEYFPVTTMRAYAQVPLILTGTQSSFDITATVKGGGVSGQAGAVRHALARVLLRIDSNFHPQLKQAGLLTRDSRVKERRKYGLKKARKASQFSKR